MNHPRIAAGDRSYLDRFAADAERLSKERHPNVIPVVEAKWLDDSVTDEIQHEHGVTIRDRINAEGLRAADAVVEELLPELSMDSTEEDVERLTQQKLSLAR